MLVEPVLIAPVLLLLELLALVLVAPVLLAMCYKHQCKKHIASGTMCYGISDMSIGHSGIVFRVLCPKISTGREKLAPAGWHGWHVFATLALTLTLTVGLKIKRDECTRISVTA